MSFHSAKLMTTVEGGMIFTDSDEHARVCRILRNQGEDPQEKYKHIMLGYNARMMDLQAAIGLVQFAKLPGYIRRRREIAARYREVFARNPKITLITVRPEDAMAWFLYPVLVENRDAVNRAINAAGIDTRFCYHLPLYRQPLFAAYAAGAHCPNAEWVGDRVINLPVYSGLSDDEVTYIVQTVDRSAAQA